MSSSFCQLRAMGMVNALGHKHESIYQGLINGDRRGMVINHDLISGQAVLVGEVPQSLDAIPSALVHLRSRVSALLLAAIRQIENEIAAAAETFGRHRIGVVIGSSTSGIEQGEEAVRYFVTQGVASKNFYYTRQEIGAVSAFVAQYLDLRGPQYTISTACSSSAKVFRSARHLLQSGLCDAVVVGGADALCRLTLHGFSALDLLSSTHSNPFSENRAGINIGEGACLFLLTRDSGGVQLRGVGDSSDAYHISAPDPQARGAIAALRAALEEAKMRADEVMYINLHGTGTIHNDAMEARAVAEVFGASTPCSSTKPLVGHMLGASGATEAGFCWLILKRILDGEREAVLPPHCYDGKYDGALPRLRLVERSERISGDKPTVMVSNSFGFGGSNCSLVFGI